MKATIYSGATGINNKVDPVRLKYDYQSGISDLASALDVDIDESGRVLSRKGTTTLQAGTFHSLFCDGGDCFLIRENTSDASIMKLNTDYTLTEITSGLSKNWPVSFCQIGSKTFYSNGLENGYIEDSIRSAWPTQAHVGADTTRYFTSAPLGTILKYFSGLMLIAQDKVIWHSEPYAFGKFNQAKGYFMFGSDVRMIKPMSSGFYVSDSMYTYFLKGTNPYEMFQERVLSFPAHSNSDAPGFIHGNDFGRPELGKCAIWSSDEGLCAGTETGLVVNLTKEKLNYPTGTQARSLIIDTSVINIVS